MSTTASTHIRWFIRRDMPDVLVIENESFKDDPWDEEHFIQCLRQRNCIGMIAEHDKQTAGFMIYELLKSRLHLSRFAVHPTFRRCGIGRRMIEKLVTKLSYQRRTRIVLKVPETNLDAQQFFKAMGFRATSVLRDYEFAGEDAYQMVYRYGVST